MNADQMTVGQDGTRQYRRRTETAVCGLVTVIVPVYNVRPYVAECIESLIGQTYRELEILLVDDGSTDGSGEICDEYAAKDDRIRVIRQQNQGLSAARNTGLDNAGGSYVAFVDSDDLAARDYIETLADMAVHREADIAACSYRRGDGEKLRRLMNDSRQTNRRSREKTLTSDQMLRAWHGRYKRYETVVWNKLYRMTLFQDAGDGALRFPLHRRQEDVLTSHLITARAQRIAITDRALYGYRVREDSITRQKMSPALKEQNLAAQRERMAFFAAKGYRRAWCNLWVGYLLHRVRFGR